MNFLRRLAKKLQIRNRETALVLDMTLLLGFVLRLFYALEMPITNDEGAYLYDALHILRGLMPYRDFLAKAPVLLYTLALFVKVFGRSLLVGRLVSTLAALATSVFLYLIGKELYDKRIGLLSASIYATFPTIVVYTVYVHTQPLQVMWVSLALYILIRGLKKLRPHYFFWHGLVLAIAFLVRQTALAMGLSSLIAMLSLGVPFKEKFKRLLNIGFGFLCLLGPVVGWALPIIGYRKTLDLLGSEIVKQAVRQKAAFTLGQMLSFFFKLFHEFLQESPSVMQDGLPLTALLFVFLGFVLYEKSHVPPKKLLGYPLLLLAFYVCLLSCGFSYSLEGSFLILSLDFIGFSLIYVLLLHFLLLPAEERRGGDDFPFFPLLWFCSVSILYLMWIKFRTPYFTEFLPSLSLMASVSLVWLWDNFGRQRYFWRKEAPRFLLVATIVFSVLVGYHRTYTHPYTGSIPPALASEVAQYLENHSEENEEILTAATIIPFLSGHRLVFNVTHPAWYAYPWISEEMLILYSPTFSEFEDYVKTKRIKYVILEGHTRFSYLSLHPEFERYIELAYEEVKSFSYGGAVVKVLRIKE